MSFPFSIQPIDFRCSRDLSQSFSSPSTSGSGVPGRPYVIARLIKYSVPGIQLNPKKPLLTTESDLHTRLADWFRPIRIRNDTRLRAAYEMIERWLLEDLDAPAQGYIGVLAGLGETPMVIDALSCWADAPT